VAHPGTIPNSLLTPITPEIYGPLDKARFFSGLDEREEIALHWAVLPRELRPEVQIHRFDDPEFKISPDVFFSGAIVNIPDGTYGWKVRSVNSQGKSSPWSTHRTFVIQESNH
jgi:hypothetical protein